MRNAVFLVLTCAVMLAIAMSRRDVAASGPGAGSGAGSGSSTVAAPEPITGEPVMPNPGDESERMPPFTMYSHGGSNAEIPYSALSADEKAWIDNEPSKGGDWQAINGAYAAASRYHAQQAGAAAAATQLGIPSPLASTGVVP